MLTVDEIKNVSFKKASIGGYRCDEVDSFIDEVVETVEELKQQDADVSSRVDTLTKLVEEYRSEKDSVSSVLVKARKDADEMREEAQLDAEKIRSDAKKEAAALLKDAKAKADRILSDAEQKIVREKKMLVQLEEEAAEIRKKLIENFEQQIESLKILPEADAPKKLKKSLDEKYPVDESKAAKKVQIDDDDDEDDDDEDGFTSIEEAAQDAKAATEDSASAEAMAQSEETSENEEGSIQIDKSKFESRFGKLKFGEDYDVKKAE
ncbi:MAG: DivIVA domain-containing protein [Clostridia bacterium]|nr:DivIVA domain-containing protein [Clostridia bacterium]